LGPAGDRSVPAGCSCGEDGSVHGDGVERLAPVVVADAEALSRVAAVNDEPAGVDFRGEVELRVEKLAAGDTDAVVEGGNVDDVWRVDVDPHSCLLGRALQRRGTPGKGEFVPFPRGGRADHDLNDARAAGLGVVDCGLGVDVGT